MKMKKIFSLACLALTAMTAAFGFTACSDDKDDEPADSATHDKELIGTWETYFKYAYEEGVERYIFRANGTGRYEEIFRGEDDYWEEFDWSTEDGYVTVEYTSSIDKDIIGDSETWQYEVRGKSLYMHGYSSDPFIKK